MAAPLWTVRLGKERRVRARTPVLTDDRVYQVFHYDKSGSFASAMLALDPGSGDELWRATVDHIVNEPVVAPDGTVFLSSFEGSVFAYDKHGRALWKAPEAKRNIGLPCLAGSRRLVVAELGQGRRTWCLDAQSGAVLWTFDSGGFSYPIAATAETVVHATAVNGAKFGERTPHLFALSAENGRVLWSKTSDNYLFMSKIVDDLVVVAARGAVLAFRLSDGKPAARLDLPPDLAVNALTPLTDGFLITDDTPSTADDAAPTLRRIVLARQHSLFGASVQIKERWSVQLPRPAVGRPIVLGSDVAVIVEGGNLHTFAADSGSPLATHNRKGDETGAGGIASSGALVAVANGRTLDVYRQSDLTVDRDTKA